MPESRNISNLDAMTDVELQSAIRAFDLLSQYASIVIDARQLRKAGAIQPAMRLEASLDEIYTKLPNEWRW